MGGGVRDSGRCVDTLADSSGREANPFGYSDATDDIAFAYDRLGRQSSVSDAQGTRTFGYDPQTLALTNETIVAGSQTNVIARTYDSLGRSAGLALGSGYAIAYGYSSVGRFDSVTSAVAGKTNDWQYAYVPDSDLLSALVQTQAGITNSRAYEPNRNLITQVLNAAPVLTISRFQYDNDPLGRRTRRIDTSAGVLSTNYFGYNARSEVTNALMSSSTFAYLYDNIGNRESSATNGLARASQNPRHGSRGLHGYGRNPSAAADSAAFQPPGTALRIGAEPATPLQLLPDRPRPRISYYRPAQILCAVDAFRLGGVGGVGVG